MVKPEMYTQALETFSQKIKNCYNHFQKKRNHSDKVLKVYGEIPAFIKKQLF
jgi:hypothetical protein